MRVSEALSSQRCVSIGTMPWEMGNALVPWIQLGRTLPIWWVKFGKIGFRSSFSPWTSGSMTGGYWGSFSIFWTHPSAYASWDGWVKKMRKDNNQQLATELWWWQVELHLWKNLGHWVESPLNCWLAEDGHDSFDLWSSVKCGLPLSGGIPYSIQSTPFAWKLVAQTQWTNSEGFHH